jgi:hypothetical protein
MHPQKSKLSGFVFYNGLHVHNSKSILTICRKKATIQLNLQESYFYNMHLLAPYFVKLVLHRLKDAYCSPQIEMASDIQFYRVCTVSWTIPVPPKKTESVSKNISKTNGITDKHKFFVDNLKNLFNLQLLQILFLFQEFVFAVLPFVFETSLETDSVFFLVGLECIRCFKNSCHHTFIAIGILIWRTF